MADTWWRCASALARRTVYWLIPLWKKVLDPTTHTEPSGPGPGGGGLSSRRVRACPRKELSSPPLSDVRDRVSELPRRQRQNVVDEREPHVAVLTHGAPHLGGDLRQLALAGRSPGAHNDSELQDVVVVLHDLELLDPLAQVHHAGEITAVDERAVGALERLAAVTEDAEQALAAAAARAHRVGGQGGTVTDPVPHEGHRVVGEAGDHDLAVD